MKENIERRKEAMREYYEQEYAPKEKKWWQSNTQFSYQSTTEVYAWSNYRRQEIQETEIIIRNDKKEATKLVASFILAICVLLVTALVGGQIAPFFIIVVLGFGMLFYVPQFFNQAPKLTLKREGLIIRDSTTIISWDDVIGAYIKKDDSGDSAVFSLLIHYYIEHFDKFESLELKLEYLNVKYQQIAAYIEYFKSKSKFPNQMNAIL